MCKSDLSNYRKQKKKLFKHLLNLNISININFIKNNSVVFNFIKNKERWVY